MLIGIVGKPSTGKSTFFKAATLAEAEIADYPFTTIKPNHAVGYVKVDCVDKEFKKQCNPREGFCINNIRFVPVELLDVAGLVPGAHEGKGLGNQFLDDLRKADILIHVIDISGSGNEKGEAVPAGSYDPLKDVKFLEDELDHWFSGILKKVWKKFSSQVAMEGKETDKAIHDQFAGLGVTLSMTKKALNDAKLNKKKINLWADEELEKFASVLRKVSKPIILAANKIDIPGADKNFERLKKEFSDYLVIPCSAESELALREAAKKELINYVPGESDFKVIKADKLSDKQKKALDFVKKILKKYKTTGVQTCLDAAVFDFLKYIVIFPGGPNKLADTKGNVLPDAFLMPPNSTALDFAYKLHTDFGDRFIKAVDARTNRALGKDYKLKHRDVLEIAYKK